MSGLLRIRINCNNDCVEHCL